MNGTCWIPEARAGHIDIVIRMVRPPLAQSYIAQLLPSTKTAIAALYFAPRLIHLGRQCEIWAMLT